MGQKSLGIKTLDDVLMLWSLLKADYKHSGTFLEVRLFVLFAGAHADSRLGEGLQEFFHAVETKCKALGQEFEFFKVAPENHAWLLKLLFNEKDEFVQSIEVLKSDAEMGNQVFYVVSKAV